MPHHSSGFRPRIGGRGMPSTGGMTCGHICVGATIAVNVLFVLLELRIEDERTGVKVGLEGFVVVGYGWVESWLSMTSGLVVGSWQA